MPNTLSRAFSTQDLERLARRKLPRAVFDFYAGGAEDEITLRANACMYQEIGLVPQVLSGVDKPDPACLILSQAASMPVVIAPMGAVGFGRRDGDICIARAAAKAGVPYVLSTTATTSIEHLAEAAGGRLWFQLYPLRDPAATAKLVARAHAAGYEALVLTADVPVGGKRERDLRNDFAMPFRYTARNLLDFASRPRWALEMLRYGIPPMPNLQDMAPQTTAASGVTSVASVASVGREFDPAFNWADLAALRRQWPGKLVLKGILHADDAERAVQAGCDAVVVSNHGGRQLDGAIASLHALPRIRERVGDQLEVLVDGGVRRGSDIAKALALGANAVMVGRPALYGVCATGEPGAAQVLQILRDEFTRTLSLCGCPSAAALNPNLLCSAQQR